MKGVDRRRNRPRRHRSRGDRVRDAPQPRAGRDRRRRAKGRARNSSADRRRDPLRRVGSRLRARDRARARLLRALLHLGFHRQGARRVGSPRDSLRRVRPRLVHRPAIVYNAELYERQLRDCSTRSTRSAWTSPAFRWAVGSPRLSSAATPSASARSRSWIPSRERRPSRVDFSRCHSSATISGRPSPFPAWPKARPATCCAARFPRWAARYRTQMRFRGFGHALLSTRRNIAGTNMDSVYRAVGRREFPRSSSGESPTGRFPSRRTGRYATRFPSAEFHADRRRRASADHRAGAAYRFSHNRLPRETPVSDSSPDYGIPPTGYRLPPATHVGLVRIQVADLDRSIAYYEEVIGFRVLERADGVARLGPNGADVGALEIARETGRAFGRAPRPNRPVPFRHSSARSGGAGSLSASIWRTSANRPVCPIIS